MPASQVEFFFSFRSPYSYLAAPRVFELPERYDIELVWRGVRPMAMRGQPLPRAKQLYILRDAAREAQRLGLPFGPIFDPLGEGVWRCLCIAEYAQRQGHLAVFVKRAARAIWGEGCDVRRDDRLREICEAAGLVWSACREAIGNAGYRQRVEDNTARLAQLGHWGVPTLHYQNQLYWGQDRIEDLEGALRAAGRLRRGRVAA
ncbi:2-hydroxychromene-2-carboxylate isomerase [Solimonas aquatica]|uniref:2-hydroxychromene-2-carboxylate isomerase n=1 Tax=Solimonas aquatica TaxID=489703 RepID=A0A1H9JVQ4_9GAMM|nr:DsbA family protein [Solimonas aquatica]SEQ90615.1 2-hydroxychromene-2-carboxylate isomerase [Solimonas aquatica]